jgi:glutathione S-transferase
LPLPALQKWLGDHLASALFTTTMVKYPQWQSGDAEPVFALKVAA